MSETRESRVDKALEQWREAIGAKGSFSEVNAFIDGFNAAVAELMAEHAPQPRPVEGAGPAHNHPLPWKQKHKFCPACEYEVAPSPAPPVEAPTNYEMLCVERYHRIQELERAVNALVTLLRAKCTDAQWAKLGMKFDVMTEPASEEALRREFEKWCREERGCMEDELIIHYNAYVMQMIQDWWIGYLAGSRSVHGSHANRIAVATLKSEPL